MTRDRLFSVLVCAAFAAACSEWISPAHELTVSGVSPNSGPLAGGAALAVAVTNLPQTIDSVRVGAVDVSVYTTAAGRGNCPGCFAYNPAIEVTWTTVAAGESHSCGLATSGAAHCWGSILDLASNLRLAPCSTVRHRHNCGTVPSAPRTSLATPALTFA